MSVHEGDVVDGDLLPRRDGRLRAHSYPRTGLGLSAHAEMENNGMDIIIIRFVVLSVSRIFCVLKKENSNEGILPNA